MQPTTLGPAPPPALGNVCSIEDVCDRMSCHATTVYRWIRAGRLPAHKMPGRNGKLWVSEDALRAFIESLAVVANGETSLAVADG